MDTLVKDLMIPIDQYPTISHNATLKEAFIKLELAHDKLAGKTYKPRSILVVDDDNQVVGKLSLWDCLRALEPKYRDIADFGRLTHFGLNAQFIRSMVEKQGLWNDPLDTLAARAGSLQVGDFMSLPNEDELVGEDIKAGLAAHQMLMGRRLSLLVQSGGKIIGFLRLCDLFQFVVGKVKEI